MISKTRRWRLGGRTLVISYTMEPGRAPRRLCVDHPDWPDIGRAPRLLSLSVRHGCFDVTDDLRPAELAQLRTNVCRREHIPIPGPPVDSLLLAIGGPLCMRPRENRDQILLPLGEYFLKAIENYMGRKA